MTFAATCFITLCVVCTIVHIYSVPFSCVNETRCDGHRSTGISVFFLQNFCSAHHSDFEKQPSRQKSVRQTTERISELLVWPPTYYILEWSGGME